MNSGRRDSFVIRMKVRDEHGNVIGETEAINFRGLLALAHEEGLRSVRTELVQVPSEENNKTAIGRATARTRKGVFAGIGDANGANVNRRIVPHIIRMAETRAMARAFRVAVNVGAVAVEELLDDLVDEAKNDNGVPTPPEPPRAVAVRSRGRDPHPLLAEPGDRRAMSDEQKKFLFRLAYQLGESRENAARRVLAALGVERFEEASRAAAAKAIDALKSELADAQERSAIVDEARRA
jgi:hypothetical protein